MVPPTYGTSAAWPRRTAGKPWSAGAQTMTAFLEQVRARYGGVTRWLAGHGFGRDDLDRLHAKLRRA
jgi:hypothetical protein